MPEKSLTQFIEDSAKQLIVDSSVRTGNRLDLTEESLGLIEAMLDEAVEPTKASAADVRERIVELFGCYILEVARKRFGGRYSWYAAQNAPVLVLGDGQASLAFLTWGKVAGRLSGDTGDNIPFFYQGFAERAVQPLPKGGAVYV